MKIEPTGDRKRKGVGWGWRKESMKKMCFPPLSTSLSLFWFFLALRDRSRVLTKLSKIRRTSVDSLDFFDVFNLSHLVCL